MRIGVIGAGAVGGTLAALLARAGHEVEVTARGENLEAIRPGGLRLDGGWGEHAARRRGHESSPIGAPERSRSSRPRPGCRCRDRANATCSGTLPLLVVQNGLGGLEAARRCSRSPLLGGLALFAASYLEPGHVTSRPRCRLSRRRRGHAARRARPRARRDRAAIPIEVTDDIVGAQWTKLLINQVNALPAITGLSVQEVVANPGCAGS